MVRRAMSKKKAKDIEKERDAFLHGDPDRNIAGCVANGIPRERPPRPSTTISTTSPTTPSTRPTPSSYAVVAYQTAWFKCHYTRRSTWRRC